MTERSLVQLHKLCENSEIHRFSAEEMADLLEDGEEVDWILEQVVDDGSSSLAQELRSELVRIQTDVAPEPVSDAPAEAPDSELVAEAPTESPLVEAMPDLRDMDLPPGIDMAQLEKVMSSPRGALLADFGAFCQERGVSDDPADGPDTEELMRELHDEWLQTPRDSLEGKRPADALEGGGLFPEKVETYRREEPKVGRNDPCPCGSGRKFKKCCGKAA